MNPSKFTNWTILFLFFFSFVINAQWIKKSFPSNESLTAVRFVSPNIGWILGEKHVFKTTDGGETWEIKDSVKSVWKGFYAIDTSNALYFDNKQGIRKTKNAGNTWSTVDTTIKDIVSFYFLNPELGFASGGHRDSMTIYKTTDKGETWNKISSTNVKHGWDFEKVFFIDTLLGWTITYNGEIYHTTDGGLNWSFQDSTAKHNAAPLRDIQFTTADSGWAVGGISGYSFMLKTINGGTTWEEITSIPNFTNSSIREIHMINSLTGWFVGSYNGPAYVAKTTDGGNTWIDQTPPNTIYGFESIYMINDSIGFLVGKDGTYLKTNNGGITGIIENNINLIQFSLSQNYPNPFNPNTTITFSIQKRSKVLLKVFNILGKEMATLVNEEKTSGNYKINFNATDFPSGIYFYKLQAGNFIETKKMILLK